MELTGIITLDESSDKYEELVQNIRNSIINEIKEGKITFEERAEILSGINPEEYLNIIRNSIDDVIKIASKVANDYYSLEAHNDLRKLEIIEKVINF